MTQVAVIGAGICGLATALFLARRGHRVDLLEKDADDPPETARDRLNGWHRRGIAQWRQPHNLLGLSSAILKEEAPDVLRALGIAGCATACLDGFPTTPDNEPFLSVVATRATYEFVMRRIVCAEPGVNFRPGVRVSGLLQHPGEPPQVTGLVTTSGDAIVADLVIDASGRFTRAAQWLAAIGARAPVERIQRTPFVYITRWYGLKTGRNFPRDATAVRAEFDFGSAFAFPADNGLFSVTILLSMSDPLRGAVMEPAGFEAAIAALPNLAAWSQAGDALSNPQAMGGLDNCLRRLADENGLIVTGFALAGDAALHTNPTLGRGCSLAMLQAQEIARTADRAVDDPSGWTADFDCWMQSRLSGWYESQVAADSARIAQMAASLAGKPAPSLDPAASFMASFAALARYDEDAARRLNRYVHLLDGPEALGDPALIKRIEHYGAMAPASQSSPALTRERFQTLVGAETGLSDLVE